MTAGAPGSDDIIPVEELTRDAMLEVAGRVRSASGFAELIYRESEIDALWSLADIAARDAALAADPGAARAAALRDEIGRAHDLLADGQCPEAAAILRAAVTLLC